MAKAKISPLQILIACGGTGGHLFPGIAVGEVLKARGHNVTLLISEKKIDALAASGHNDLTFEKMPFLALPPILSPKIVPFAVKFISGIRACRKLIQTKKIQVVLGMGGFTSTAPVLAGKWNKSKTLIHDSNAFPGKANRFTAKYCDRVLLGFKECAQHFPKQETSVVGTPVRSTLRAASKMNLEDPYAFFGLKKDRKTLLIIGGSQGARGVNNAVAHSLNQLDELGIQLLHITGPTDYQEARDSYQNKEIAVRSHVAAFCHRMELAYQIADIALARSGASTLAELAFFGVPSILVPYPTAADDHQTKNAEIFDKAGAGILIKEADLSPEKLAGTVKDILKKDSKRKGMIAAARKLSVDNSAEKIADIVEELGK